MLLAQLLLKRRPDVRILTNRFLSIIPELSEIFIGLDIFNGRDSIRDNVNGVRKARDTDTWFKRWTAMRYYGLLRALGVDIVPNHADFRLMGRKAIAALGQYSEVNLFLRGIIPQLGYRSTSVHYDRAKKRLRALLGVKP